MKIKYQVFDFKKMTVQEREREIDIDKSLEQNAFYQMLKRNAAKSERP